MSNCIFLGNFSIAKGSVYFTGDILVATDRLERYCASSRRFGLV